MENNPFRIHNYCNDSVWSLRKRVRFETLTHQPETQEKVIRCLISRNGSPALYGVETQTGSVEILKNAYVLASIFDFIDGVFSVDDMKFNNLPNWAQNRILDHRIHGYILDYFDRNRLEEFLSTILP